MVDERDTEVSTEVEDEEVLESSDSETEVANPNAESEDVDLEGRESDEEATNEGAPPSSQDTDSEEEEDPYVPLSKLKKVRNEAKNLRERLKTAEAERDDLTTRLAERDDSELQKQISTLQAELQTERLTGVLTQAVSDAGAIDPQILVDKVSLADVEWEGTKPTNIDDLVSSLKDRYPIQFKRTAGSGNVGARDDKTRKNFNQMTVDETERAAAEAFRKQLK